MYKDTVVSLHLIFHRMKKRLPEMQRNIAEGLGIDIDQVHVKVSSMDGQDEVARLEGIEARVLVSQWEGL